MRAIFQEGSFLSIKRHALACFLEHASLNRNFLSYNLLEGVFSMQFKSTFTSTVLVGSCEAFNNEPFDGVTSPGMDLFKLNV